ncbi:VCBS repeat-containing protein [Myxococcota bacterium]|nr:VCBS repeat-containing protein [Myxococcota bacterium]
MRARAISTSVVAALAALLGCAEPDGVLPIPPPGDAESFLLAVHTPEETRVEAHAIGALPSITDVLRAPHADVTFSLRYLDDALAAYGLVEGLVTPARPTEPSRALPAGSASWIARTVDGRLRGWVHGALFDGPDPDAGVLIPCAPDQHDGGDAICAPRGACNAGFHVLLDGTCAADCGTTFGDCLPYVMSWASDLGLGARPRIGDLDGDGAPEVVATAYDRVVVLEPSGAGLRQESLLVLGEGVQAAYGIGLGDADGDGATNLVVGTWRHDLFDLAYEGRQLVITRRIPRQGYGHWAVEILELDGQPGLELAISDRYGYFRIFRWSGSEYSEWYESPRIGMATDETGKTVILGAGDTDGDGRPELATYSTLGFVDLWETSAAGVEHTFAGTFDTTGTDGADAFRGAIGDGDGDGVDDLFYADQFGALIGLSWDGAALVPRWVINLGFDAASMAIGDVDPDPARELVVGSQSGRTIVIDLETPMIEELDTFAASTRWLDVGDLDGDGKDEILAGYQDGFVRLFWHR